MLRVLATIPALLGLAALATACGGGQTRGSPLDREWSDEDGRELQSFVARWAPPERPSMPDVAVGVVSPSRLIGRSIGKGERWTFEHPLESRPHVAGNVVVGLGDGELFALDALSGEPLWYRNALGQIRGASDDGNTTVVCIASVSGARTTVLAIERNGSVVRQLYEEGVVGPPAVFDAYAFLPYRGNTVVVLDVLAGSEAARVISDQPIERVVAWGYDLYFAGEGALRFDGAVVGARTGGGTRIAIPERNFPGSPRWLSQPSGPLPVALSKSEHARYFARPRSRDGRNDRVGIHHYALSYRRIVVGLEAPEARTRWVRSFDDAVLDGSEGRDTLALCDAGGQVHWLDIDSGEVVFTTTLGERLISCAIQSDGAPPASRPVVARRLAPSPQRGEGWGGGHHLATQLRAAISLTDGPLAPIQLELLDDLAALDGDEATSALLAVAREDRPEPRSWRRAIGDKARELVGRRASGGGAMLDALRREARDDERLGKGWHPWMTRPKPPVAEMARALARMKVTDASPFLAPYLHHPGLADHEIETLAQALATLAGQGQRLDLVRFFARHRCATERPHLARAALAAARALTRLGAAKTVQRGLSEACDDGAMRKRSASPISEPAR